MMMRAPVLCHGWCRHPAELDHTDGTMPQDQRQHRSFKRQLKKRGHKVERAQAKRRLTADPATEPEAEPSGSGSHRDSRSKTCPGSPYGRYSTAGMNGYDRDGTRKYCNRDGVRPSEREAQ
jgi:hypothetical protein